MISQITHIAKNNKKKHTQHKTCKRCQEKKPRKNDELKSEKFGVKINKEKKRNMTSKLRNF